MFLFVFFSFPHFAKKKAAELTNFTFTETDVRKKKEKKKREKTADAVEALEIVNIYL